MITTQEIWRMFYLSGKQKIPVLVQRADNCFQEYLLSYADTELEVTNKRFLPYIPPKHFVSILEFLCYHATILNILQSLQCK